MKFFFFIILILAVNTNGNSLLKNIKEEKTTTAKSKTEDKQTTVTTQPTVSFQPTATSHDSAILDEDDVHHIESQLEHLAKMKRRYSNHDARVLVKDVHNLFACLDQNSEIHDCVKIRSFR